MHSCMVEVRVRKLQPMFTGIINITNHAHAQQHDHPVHSFADIVSGGCTSNSSVLESPLRVAHGCSLHPEIISSTRPAFALPPAPHISAPPSTCTTDVVGQTQSTCSGFYKVKKREVPLNRKRLRDDLVRCTKKCRALFNQMLANYDNNRGSSSSNHLKSLPLLVNDTVTVIDTASSSGRSWHYPNHGLSETCSNLHKIIFKNKTPKARRDKEKIQLGITKVDKQEHPEMGNKGIL